jgi:dephospho-CoA kinase
MVVAVIPLLFEVGLADQVDTIVLVDAPPDLRLARLMADRGLDEAQARAMIRAQMPAEIKRQRATHVVENEGDLEALASRVDELWEMLAADPRAAAPPA